MVFRMNAMNRMTASSLIDKFRFDNMSDAPETDNLDRFLNEKCLKIQKFVFSQTSHEFLREFGEDQIPGN